MPFMNVFALRLYDLAELHGQKVYVYYISCKIVYVIAGENESQDESQ